jgi:hypothetical protein
LIDILIITGTFKTDSLSYFIVFEIPTFLLFTLVIYAIYIWKSIKVSRRFFPTHQKAVPIFGVAFVWSIWIIVTVVYAEVILSILSFLSLSLSAKSSFLPSLGNTPTTACPGRAEPSYDEMMSQTRTLTVAYQSILIGITAILVGIFLFFTYLLTKSSQHIKRANYYIMIVGAVIGFSFLLRCILFVIILAADFASAVYMFVTLLITEVLPMGILLILFNRYYLFLALSYVSSGSLSPSRPMDGSQSSSSRQEST